MFRKLLFIIFQLNLLIHRYQTILRKRKFWAENLFKVIFFKYICFVYFWQYLHIDRAALHYKHDNSLLVNCLARDSVDQQATVYWSTAWHVTQLTNRLLSFLQRSAARSKSERCQSPHRKVFSKLLLIIFQHPSIHRCEMILRKRKFWEENFFKVFCASTCVLFIFIWYIF